MLPNKLYQDPDTWFYNKEYATAYRLAKDFERSNSLVELAMILVIPTFGISLLFLSFWNFLLNKKFNKTDKDVFEYVAMSILKETNEFKRIEQTSGISIKEQNELKKELLQNFFNLTEWHTNQMPQSGANFYYDTLLNQHLPQPQPSTPLSLGQPLVQPSLPLLPEPQPQLVQPSAPLLPEPQPQLVQPSALPSSSEPPPPPYSYATSYEGSLHKAKEASVVYNPPLTPPPSDDQTIPSAPLLSTYNL